MTLRDPLVLILCTAIASPLARAQGDAPTKSSPTTATVGIPAPTPRPDGPSSGPILSVDFPGGTAKEFVEAVRQAAGTSRVNVILPKEADAIPIPAISLRDVTAYTALQSLEFAVPPETGTQFKIGRIGKTDETSATFAVQFSSRNLTIQSYPSAKLETHVISIRELTDPPTGLAGDPNMSSSPETILNALKAASQLDLDARIPPPEIMFHKESQLLIVRGTADQLRTLETVIGQLRFSLDARRSEAVAAADREKNARLQKVELQAQMDLTHSQQAMAVAELDHATRDFDRIKALVDAGQASAMELDNAKALVARARAAEEQAAAAAHGLKERQTILEARAQAGGGSEAGPSELVVPVVYDVRDLNAYSQDIIALCHAVAVQGGAPSDNRVAPSYSDSDHISVITVSATPAQHRILVRALNTIRRAKANEPKLPGLDADDLIRKGAGE